MPRPRPRNRLPIAVILLLVAAATTSLDPAPAHAQECWATGPGHGEYGVDDPVSAVGTWDPDGPGPGGRWLIFGEDKAGVVRGWTGAEWVQFPGWLNGAVHAIVEHDGSLYIAGKFLLAGNQECQRIARWDGVKWAPVPGVPWGEVGDEIRALESFAGYLWAGGNWAFGDGRGNCAAWDGVDWIPVSGGFDSITDFAPAAGGWYACSETGASGHVLRWVNGENWTLLASANRGVRALADYGGELVVGGVFTELAGQPRSGIARWTGSAWASLGTGIDPWEAGHHVAALQTWNGHLYALGKFTSMDQVTTTYNVARWNGAWSDVGAAGLGWTNMYKYPAGLTLYQNEVVAVGYIPQAGNNPAQHVARWNGTSWRPFQEGLNGRIRRFVAAGSNIYAGGDFSFTWEGAGKHRVTLWNGSSFDGLSSISHTPGVSGPVHALTFHAFNVFSSRLIVGGNFQFAGSQAASNVASFEFGPGWAPIGAGFNGPVHELASYASKIYAAGAFTHSGATPLQHKVALWTTGGWVDAGFGNMPGLDAMTVLGGQLLLGMLTGGAHGVSAWNGTTLANWGAANGPVTAFAMLGPDLVAAGSFSTIGGVNATGVAIRSAATGQWSALGDGLAGGVNALAIHEGQLFAGGTFIQSGATPVWRLARWTGSAWVPVVDGLDHSVDALASANGSLHVGGQFAEPTGGHNFSPYWIEVRNCTGVGEPIVTAVGGVELAPGVPNPMRATTRLDFTLARPGHARLDVFDVAGRLVRTLADGPHAAGLHAAAWNGADAAGRPSAPGVYYVRLAADGQDRTRSVILLR
jgi:hypothetical protein